MQRKKKKSRRSRRDSEEEFRQRVSRKKTFCLHYIIVIRDAESIATCVAKIRDWRKDQSDDLRKQTEGGSSFLFFFEAEIKSSFHGNVTHRHESSFLLYLIFPITRDERKLFSAVLPSTRFSRFRKFQPK